MFDLRRFLVPLTLSLCACSSTTTPSGGPTDAAPDTTAPDAAVADAAVGDAAVADSAVADAGLPAYPAGPYGLRQGDVFPLLVLKGYRGGVAPFGDVSTNEYYDPSGARGIRAVHLTVQGSWCSPCLAFEKIRVGFSVNAPTAYATKGVRFVTALMQGPTFNPAKQADLDAWLVRTPSTFDLLADPEDADAGVRARTIWDVDGGANTGNTAIPTSYAIDPRTMKIVSLETGFDDKATSISGIDTLLLKNP